jgi:hypothetical protein
LVAASFSSSSSSVVADALNELLARLNGLDAPARRFILASLIKAAHALTNRVVESLILKEAAAHANIVASK